MKKSRVVEHVSTPNTNLILGCLSLLSTSLKIMISGCKQLQHRAFIFVGSESGLAFSGFELKNSCTLKLALTPNTHFDSWMLVYIKHKLDNPDLGVQEVSWSRFHVRGLRIMTCILGLRNQKISHSQACVNFEHAFDSRMRVLIKHNLENHDLDAREVSILPFRICGFRIRTCILILWNKKISHSEARIDSKHKFDSRMLVIIEHNLENHDFGVQAVSISRFHVRGFKIRTWAF